MLERQPGGFPCQHPALENGEIFATGGLKLLKRLLGALAAAADHHAAVGSVRDRLDGCGIEPVERHQMRAGDVHFLVFHRRADIDQRHAGAGLESVV